MKTLFTLGLALAAAGSTNLILGDTTSTTDIAGGSGTDVRVVGPSGNYQGLYEIAWAEDSDIPCWFQVRSRHLNTRSVQTNEANLGGRSCNETSRSQRSVSTQQGDLYISGISVCRNNQRIKGIQLHFSHVGASGTVTPSSAWPSTATQPNCTAGGTWSPTRHCPSGRIATQLRIHHKSDTPPLGSQIKEAATSIALVCRPVERK